MKVYHGTALSNLPAILKKGLAPRKHKVKSNWKHSIESNPDTVYFTDAYALYFALNAMRIDNGKDDKAVLIEVDTDDLPGLLVPDEDALEQAGRNQDGLPPSMDMIARTRHYRKMTRRFAETDLDFFWSMQTLGTGGHIGVVPSSCFRRIAVIDVQKDAEVAWAFMDASVSVMNYRFIGAKFRLLTKLIFGDTPDPADMEYMSGFPMPLPTFHGGIQVSVLEGV